MEKELSQLIHFVREHPTARLYAEKWGTETAFESLPAVSRKELACAPMASRRYKEGGGLARVLRDADGPLLIEWSYADIAAEPYGVPAARPLVYFADPGESLTAAAWCYEHNMVPLIGEQNAAVVVRAAEAYQVDALLCDGRSLVPLEPYLTERRAPLESISVVDTSFSSGALSAARYAKRVRLVLALPETGAFAESSPDTYPTFSVLPGCMVEEDDGLILTKVAHLVTPVIRYRTGLRGLPGKKNGTQTFALA